MNIWMLLLLFLAGLFLVYPWLTRSRRSGLQMPREARITDTNVELYREQLSVFQKQLADTEISQQQFDVLEQELQQQLLLDTAPLNDELETAEKPAKSGKWLVLICLMLLPVMSIGLYWTLGASRDVALAKLLSQSPGPDQSEQDIAGIRSDILEKIASRLSTPPKLDERSQAAYLVTAARLHLEQSEFVQAASYYQQAVAIYPSDPSLLAEYAQASYFASGNVFTPVVKNAMEQSLALNPANETALGLQGISFFEAGNYQQAVNSWQKALANLPPYSAQAQALMSGIARAEELIGGSQAQENAVPDTGSDSAKDAAAVVHVSLSPELAAAPEQVVYVFAREWQGMPMPLAVAKLSVANLPATVVLNDQMIMPGGKPISQAREIQLVARVSSSGSVQTRSGDLQGLSGPWSLQQAADGIQLVIDSRL